MCLNGYFVTVFASFPDCVWEFLEDASLHAVHLVYLFVISEVEIAEF